VQKNLSELTVKSHINILNVFLKEYKGNPFEASKNTVAHVFKDAAIEQALTYPAHTQF